MSEETKRVLEMVAAGKITVEEGERLIGVLGAGQSAPPPVEGERPAPRFLKMEAGATGKDGKEEGFRMRVPLDLLRAGIKMRALIPETKRDRINEKLREKGIEGDVFEMSEDEIDALIRSLGELEIEGGDGDGGFRLYLE
jgi:polyhydroxyalkanoate synthesis regulator phasin